MTNNREIYPLSKGERSVAAETGRVSAGRYIALRIPDGNIPAGQQQKAVAQKAMSLRAVFAGYNAITLWTHSLKDIEVGSSDPETWFRLSKESDTIRLVVELMSDIVSLEKMEDGERTDEAKMSTFLRVHKNIFSGGAANGKKKEEPFTSPRAKDSYEFIERVPYIIEYIKMQRLLAHEGPLSPGQREEIRTFLKRVAVENLYETAGTIFSNYGTGKVLNVEDITVESLKELDDIIEVFNSCSHDLRTPLTSLVGFLQLVNARLNKGKDIYSIIPDINRNTDNLSDLLAGVADELRHEHYEPPTFQEAESALLAKVATLQQVGGANVSFTIEGDRRDGYQVAMHLPLQKLIDIATNMAVNSASHGAKNIRVTFGFNNDTNNAVVVVEDDGEGIHEDIEKFGFRDGVTHRNGGHGDGMSAAMRNLESRYKGSYSVVKKNPQIHGETGTIITLFVPGALVPLS